MSANKPLMFFASESEEEAQEWMHSLRNSLWPPCFSFRMLTASTHEVSLIDDKNSFLSGLLGVYGRMVLSSNDVISIIHPHWGATLLQIPLASIHGVHLVREAEVSSSGIFRIVLKGAEDLDFRMFQFYCSTARDAIQWILGKVIARDLDDQSGTKPISLNNHTDLPTFPLYDSPIPKQCSEIPNAILTESQMNYNYKSYKSENVKNNFSSKTQSEKPLQEEMPRNVQSTYLVMNNSAKNLNIANDILLHECKICLNESKDTLYENVKHENMTLDSEQCTNIDVKMDYNNTKSEYVQKYFSSRAQSKKLFEGEMHTDVHSTYLVMNKSAKNQNIANDILCKNVKHKNIALESEKYTNNGVKNFPDVTTIMNEFIELNSDEILKLSENAVGSKKIDTIDGNKQMFSASFSESNDVLYENVKHENLQLELEQCTNIGVENATKVPIIMNQFSGLNNSDETLNPSEYAMVNKKFDAIEVHKQMSSTSLSEKNVFSEKRTATGVKNSECIDTTLLVESCTPKPNIFMNGTEYAAVNKVHAAKNKNNELLKNESFERNLKYKIINDDQEKSLKTLKAIKDKEQIDNSQIASKLIKSSILSIPCSAASSETLTSNTHSETSVNVFQSNFAKNGSVSTKDILKQFDENCIENIELNNHVYEQVVDRRGTIYEEIDESDDDDFMQESLPPPNLPAKPSNLEIPSSLRLQKLSQNITGVLQEMEEPLYVSKETTPQLKLVKKIKDSSRIMHV